MRISFFSLLLLIQLTVVAQSNNAEALVQEGVSLHDQQQYEKALAKYDAAIALSPDFMDAYYEKTFTLSMMKKHTECVELCKFMLKQFAGSPGLKAVYVQYGSSLDDMGKSEEAIKAYNEGLKKFPDYFLIHFNKGITYSQLNDFEKAYESYQEALTANPFHSSSYFRTTDLLKSSKHIPAMLAGIMHLIIEPQSERSVATLDILKELMYGNVKKTGDNAVTITMDVSMLDNKKSKKQVDNFSMEEMMFSLSSALDKDSVMNTLTKTEIEKFDLKLQLLINSLTTDGKGFFKERYVPFFKQLKENNHTMLVSRLVFASSGDERNAAWLKVNTEKTADFYDWLEAYKWPK